MAKPMGEVKFKGLTIDEHAKSEKGRGLLRWIIDQPIADDKFKSWTTERNQYIQDVLERAPQDATSEVSPVQALANDVKDLKVRVGNIEAKLIKEDDSEPTGWDT